LDKVLCLRAGDEHIGGDGEVQAIEFLVPDEIGDRLAPGAAGDQGLVRAELGWGKGVFGIGIEPGPVSPQDVGQQHFGVQAR
jgi:hypothetical protein